MFSSEGTLRYTDDPYKLVVIVEQDIGRYYYSQVPKYVYLKRPMWRTHISVVRKQVPTNLEAWKRHKGRVVTFEYDPYVHNDERYWWINAWSEELEEVRKELGLPIYPDASGRHRFHITIGNTKPQNTPV